LASGRIVVLSPLVMAHAVIGREHICPQWVCYYGSTHTPIRECFMLWWGDLKTTIHPRFSGTVPIFKWRVPEKKSLFSRDAHLLHFWLKCPGFAAICPSLQSYVYASVAKKKLSKHTSKQFIYRSAEINAWIMALYRPGASTGLMSVLTGHTEPEQMAIQENGLIKMLWVCLSEMVCVV